MGTDRPRDAAACSVLTKRAQRFGCAPRSGRVEPSEPSEPSDPPEQAEPSHAFSAPAVREISVHWLRPARRDSTFTLSVRRPSGRNWRSPLFAERAWDPLLWEGLRVSIWAGRRAFIASRPALLFGGAWRAVRWRVPCWARAVTVGSAVPSPTACRRRRPQRWWPRPCAARQHRRARWRAVHPARRR